MDYRLKRQKDFNEVFTKGKRAYTKLVTILYLDNKPQLKIGISVGKKHGNAVVRNKIKRLIRAAYRNYLPLLKNSSIVILPKAQVEIGYKDYCDSLLFLFKREKLFIQ